MYLQYFTLQLPHSGFSFWLLVTFYCGSNSSFTAHCQSCVLVYLQFEWFKPYQALGYVTPNLIANSKPARLDGGIVFIVVSLKEKNNNNEVWKRTLYDGNGFTDYFVLDSVRCIT